MGHLERLHRLTNKVKSIIISLNFSSSQLEFHWLNLSLSSFIFSLTLFVNRAQDLFLHRHESRVMANQSPKACDEGGVGGGVMGGARASCGQGWRNEKQSG